jgi:hypothetical protein
VGSANNLTWRRYLTQIPKRRVIPARGGRVYVNTCVKVVQLSVREPGKPNCWLLL